MDFIKTFEGDLAKDITFFFNLLEKNNIEFSNVIIEKESKEYGALKLIINNKSAIFRVAKTTPTKTGQFVTLWQRDKGCPIKPYDINDGIDKFIILVKQDDKLGCFIFPTEVLAKQDILSNNSTLGKNPSGKRAIRVYAPWDSTQNKQAVKTQKWQSQYFFNIDNKLFPNSQF
jgi:hypothetical protein